MKPRKVIVGCDVRKSSPVISSACIEGLLGTSCEVIDIGIVSTPCLYFSSAHLGADCGVVITASHNPPEYTGFKVCRQNAIPVGSDSGLAEIEKIFNTVKMIPQSSGKRGSFNVISAYRNHLMSFGRFENGKKKRVVVDMGSGAVSYSFKKLFDWIETFLEVIPICDRPDGNFPNHEPDPLKDENIADLRKKVVETRSDFGVAFDGDGDRLICVDEKGTRVEGDIIACIIAKELVKKGESMIYDVRSSKVIEEEMQKIGVKAIKERVGHAFIKQTMRKKNAVFGGELSGHYYFRDNFYADSGEITFVLLSGIFQRSDNNVSQIAESYRKYAKTGEINFKVKSGPDSISKVKKFYSGCIFEELDGLSVVSADFWFNLRPSNTEPLLRLNAEANTKSLLDQVVKNISVLLKT